MKFFRSSPDRKLYGAGFAEAHSSLQRFERAVALLGVRENLCVLDLDPLRPPIFALHGTRHRHYSEDLLTASTDPELLTKDEQVTAILDSRKFLADNLVYPAAHFDVVLCWNLPDYLDESLVKAGRRTAVVRAEARRNAARILPTPATPVGFACHRFHIVGTDTLEMQKIELRREARRGPTARYTLPFQMAFQLQRVFNNRHIETLFRDFASIKFFLARDNVREVLVVR